VSGSSTPEHKLATDKQKAMIYALKKKLGKKAKWPGLISKRTASKMIESLLSQDPDYTQAQKDDVIKDELREKGIL